MATEKRLIDANALESKLQEHHDFFVDGVGEFRFLTPKDKARVDEITNCIAEVGNAPTVDAVEVVHSSWVRLDAHKGMEQFKCSVCRSECYVPTCMNEPMYAYCPNCGAKMDGDGNG